MVISLTVGIILPVVNWRRKILRKIYGPTQNPDGIWRIKTNDELRHRMKQEDIIKFVKSQRLRWAAHVMRM